MKLGRALGYGTRHMAKTVAAVAEAATAPQVGTPGEARPPAAVASSAAAPPRPRAMEGRVVPDRAATRDLGKRAHHLKRAVWQPLAVFSGALWLRVTGTFFALIASTMGAAAWRGRSELHAAAGSAAAGHFWILVGFAALFGYFAVSSFLRANLKERRARLSR